jgi:subtilisin family serine protease
MGRKNISLTFVAALAIALLLAIGPKSRILADDSKPPSPLPLSQHSGVPLQLALDESVVLTLITGEKIRATGTSSGRLDVQHLFPLTGAIPANSARSASAHQSVDVDKLDDLLFDVDYLVSERFHERTTLPVIIIVVDGESLDSITSLIESLGGVLTWESQNLSLVGADFPYEGIETAAAALTNHQAVERIWLDAIFRVALDESIHVIEAPSVHAMGFRGEGVIVAILDTGVDSTHPDLDDLDDNSGTFDPKIVYTANFSTETSTVEDLMGHGTHVAGIATGTGKVSRDADPNGPQYVGVAPGAFLWNIKVLNGGGSGSVTGIAEGIEHAALGEDGEPRSGDEPDVINLSVGNRFNGSGTDPMSLAVDFAVSQGVTVVVAVGNWGPRLSSVGQPAVSKHGITVGAVDNDDKIASFSGRGPTTDRRLKPDVVAPGVGIVSTCASQGSKDTCGFINQRYNSLSGTSMATPHVAGAAALVIQAHPDWTPEQVKSALMNTAYDIDVPLREQGAGRIHVPSAIDTSLLASEPSLSFGLVTTGQTRVETITIQNLGDQLATAQATDSTLLSGIPSGIVSVSPTTFKIDPGGTADINVTLGPVDSDSPQGWYEGRVRIGSTVGVIFVPYLFFVSQPSEITVSPVVFDQIKIPSIDLLKQQTTQLLSIVNNGSAPVGFAILEDFLTGGSVAFDDPVGVQTLGNEGVPVFVQQLPEIIDDPLGDYPVPITTVVDVRRISAKSSDQFVALQIEFSEDTVMPELQGLIFLDVDQDPTTGRPPTFKGGSPAQDIGYEFYIDLADLLTQNEVRILDKNDNFRGRTSGQVIENKVYITLPNSLIGGDDGSVDISAAFFTLSGPTDWAPDVGHGTLTNSDVPWISFDPPFGTVGSATTTKVAVTFDARYIPEGLHVANVLVGNNDPNSLVSIVPITFDVSKQSPNIHVAPTAISASMDSGNATVESFTVSNTSKFANGFLTIALLDEDTSTGADAAWLSLVPDTVLVQPNGSIAIQAVFDSTGLPTGTYSADVTIENDDPSPGPTTVTATLTVSSPEVDISPVAFELGQAPGQVTTHTLTVHNQGTGTLNFDLQDTLDLGAGPTNISPIDSPRIAVFEDELPWDSDVVHDTLDDLGLQFDVFTSSNMGVVSLLPYSKVIVSSAQSNEFYDALIANALWFEQYVNGGGNLEMHLEAAGRLGLDLGLPGGFRLNNAAPLYDVQILERDRPLFNGPHPISDAELSYWNPSARSYILEMPAGAQVLAEWQSRANPIAAEYKLGKGRILVTTQYVEHIYASRRFLENLLSYRALNSPWLAIEPDSGTVSPGNQVDLTLTVDSNQLGGGVHAAKLVLSTNDPAAPDAEIPISVAVVGPPALIAPGDNTKSPDMDWTFEWLTVPSVTEYTLHVDRVPTFDSPDLRETLTLETNHTLTLNATGPYYWRVRGGIGGSADTDWSSVRRFTRVAPIARVSFHDDLDENPAVAELSDGSLITVWSNGDDLWLSTSADSGPSWSERLPVTTDSSGADAADLHVASDGTLWLTYWAWEGANSEVRVQTSGDGGLTWSASTRISDHPAGDFSPSVTQTLDGTIWVVWSSSRSGQSEIWHRTSADGGASWSDETPAALSSNPKSDPEAASLMDGSLLLAWQECSGTCRILFARSDNQGASWSSAVTVGSDEFDNRWPSIAVTPDERIWIAWTSWRNSNPNSRSNWDILYAESNDGGSTWSDEIQFTAHAGPDEHPEITPLTHHGSVGLVWHSQRSGNFDVWFGIVDHLEDVLIPPVITSISHTPSPNPEAGEEVTITAQITDHLGIASAEVTWVLDGDPQTSLPMIDDGTNGDLIANDGTYTVTIGPFQAGELVVYQIGATNLDEVSVVVPTDPESFLVQQTFVQTELTLLVIDSAQSSQVEIVRPYYIAALDSIDTPFDLWDVSRRGEIRPEVLDGYRDGTAIWSMPFCCGTLNLSTTRLHLKSYLESGGKLFLTGQDVAQTLEGSELLRQTLGTIFVGPSAGVATLVGVEDDPVGGGLVIQTVGGDGANNQISMDEVAPLMEHAVTAFTYDANNGSVAIPIGGIRAETETYKAVLLSFGFEAIDSSAQRTKLLRRTVNWLMANEDNEVTVSPVVDNVAVPGQTLSVSIEAGAIENLAQAEVLLVYDRSALSVQSAQVAQALGTDCQQETFDILPEGLRLSLSCEQERAGAPLPLWQIDFKVASLGSPTVTNLSITDLGLANGEEIPDPIFGQGGSAAVEIALLKCGDIDGDGDVNVQDAIAALQHATGRIQLVGYRHYLANVVPSESVDVLDIILLLKHIVNGDGLEGCGDA